MILATFATIIASQAIITGSFSLTRQAMQLGWFPGVKIRQTSDTEYGQIYVPAINWLMMLGTVALAYGFGSSDRLAGAYGTAVSTTMLLTTGLLFTAMRLLWRWPLWAALLVSGLFLLIDLAFFGANLLKLLEGGWIPLVVGAAIYLVMTTWHAGIQAIRTKFDHHPQDPATFLASLERGKIVRTPGTAVFFSRNPAMIPAVLVNHVAQFKSLAETVVDLTIVFEEIPRVTHEQRAETKKLEHGLWQVLVRFGFLEVPNVPAALAARRRARLPARPHRRHLHRRPRRRRPRGAPAPPRRLAPRPLRPALPQRRPRPRPLRPTGRLLRRSHATDLALEPV